MYLCRDGKQLTPPIERCNTENKLRRAAGGEKQNFENNCTDQAIWKETKSAVGWWKILLSRRVDEDVNPTILLKVIKVYEVHWTPALLATWRYERMNLHQVMLLMESSLPNDLDLSTDNSPARTAVLSCGGWSQYTPPSHRHVSNVDTPALQRLLKLQISSLIGCQQHPGTLPTTMCRLGCLKTTRYFSWSSRNEFHRWIFLAKMVQNIT